MRFGSSAVSKILIVLSGAAFGGAAVTTAAALTTPLQPSFHQLAPLKIAPAPDWFHPAQPQEPGAAPVTLLIPSLNISAPVKALGVTVDYSLEAPAGISEVGWYRLGATPGSPGNAIMSGHLGYPGGKPAIFNGIPRLHSGDEVEVQFADGTAVRFAVDRVYKTPYRDLPAGFFATKGPSRLTLITCIGDYRANELTYSDRLVVEARPLVIPKGEI